MCCFFSWYSNQITNTPGHKITIQTSSLLFDKHTSSETLSNVCCFSSDFCYYVHVLLFIISILKSITFTVGRVYMDTVCDDVSRLMLCKQYCNITDKRLCAVTV